METALTIIGAIVLGLLSILGLCIVVAGVAQYLDENFV